MARGLNNRNASPIVRPEKALRELRVSVLVFLVTISALIYFFVNRVYSQAASQTFYRLRLQAEDVAARIEERLFEGLHKEEKRSPDQYTFFSVAENKLLNAPEARYSPLSSLPPEAGPLGTIGFFQINSSGVLSSPVLPEMATSDPQAPMGGLSLTELTERRAHVAKLALMLANTRLITGRGGGSDRYDSAVSHDKSGAKDFDGQERHGGVAVGDLELDSRLEQQQKLSIAAQQEDSKLQSAYSFAGSFSRRESKTQTWKAVGKQKELLLEKMEPARQRNFAQDDIGAPSQQSQAAANIPRIEPIETLAGEVDPLQCAMLAGGRLVFFRNVWTGRERLIQGLIVDTQKFLFQTLDDLFEGAEINRSAGLLTAYNGQILKTIAPAAVEASPYSGKQFSPADEIKNRAGNIVLFRRSLAAPLGKFELIFTAKRITVYAPEMRLINLAVAVTVLVLLAGLFGIYRFGVGQIRLAQQRSDFVSAVSHELKTPLTSIRMYSEMLRSDWVADEEKRKSYYDFIFNESERLSRLIANVLQLARLSRNTEPLVLKEYAPDELLDLLLSKVSSQVEAAGFRLEILKPDRPADCTVRADEDALVQIFMNLTDNALKFSKSGEEKRVQLGYRRTADAAAALCFFIRDFGPGIERSLKRKVFELFYRAGNELTRATPGTGIGLALVKELVSRMGARVDFENKEKGVEFRVWLSGEADR